MNKKFEIDSLGAPTAALYYKIMHLKNAMVDWMEQVERGNIGNIAAKIAQESHDITVKECQMAAANMLRLHGVR